MLEAAVDRLRGTVGGAGSVEEREDIGRALCEGSAESAELDQRRGDAMCDGVDDSLHEVLPGVFVGVAVGGDHAWVDAPRRFDLDMLLDLEHSVEAGVLAVGEEVGAGVQGPPRPVERIGCSAPVPVQGLLNTSAALIEGVAGEPDHVEGVHHGHRVGKLLRSRGLEAGDPVHRDDLHPVPPGLWTCREPALEHGLGPAGHHVQQPCRPRPGAVRGEVDDHGHELVAVAGVSPDMLVDTDHGDRVEPARIIDQEPAPFSEDGGVRGVPRHPETCSDPGHGKMVDHDAGQRPPQPAARELRPFRCRPGRVFTPTVSAVPAPIPAHSDQQRRGPMPERFVRQPPCKGSPRPRFGAAAMPPRVGISQSALDHRFVVVESLPDCGQAELVEAAEGCQVRGREGSVVHVEVFRTVSVRTSILGDLDLLPRLDPPVVTPRLLPPHLRRATQALRDPAQEAGSGPGDLSEGE